MHEKHVYFVRHGESESNADGVHRGAHSLLTQVGEEQARVVAERIARIEVDALVSSPFRRAMATAEPIRERTGLAIEECALFVERRRPSLVVGRAAHDPATADAMQQIFEGYAAPSHRHSDEENLDDLRTRANEALSFLEQHQSNRICVVTHGLFLRVLFCAVLHGKKFTGLELQNTLRCMETANTGVSHFLLQEDGFSPEPKFRWHVINWNDSAHLG